MMQVSTANQLGVGDLRNHIQEYVSLEAIGMMITENPLGAKSELLAACRKVFAAYPWTSLDVATKNIIAEQLLDVVFGFGPLEPLISDETITEIMVNGASDIYIEKHGQIEKSSVCFESEEQLRVLIDRIVGPLGRRIDEASPIVNARLPKGQRVNIVIPPISADGTCMTIRSFGKRSLTLGEMAQSGAIEPSVVWLLTWLVKLRKNIVVSGGTGSGKTTMLNALSHIIDVSERIITIEDSLELKLSPKAHVVRMEARSKNAEGGGEISIRDLVVNALRMRPDRIVVGECRGAEAWDMLQAMSTGHDGSLTTLHANSPSDVIHRMVTMVRYAADLPLDAIEGQIGTAFDVVVQVSRDKDGHRFLSHIAEVSFNYQDRRSAVDVFYERRNFKSRGKWVRKPHILDAILEQAAEFPALLKEVEQWEQMELSAYAA